MSEPHKTHSTFHDNRHLHHRAHKVGHDFGKATKSSSRNLIHESTIDHGASTTPANSDQAHAHRAHINEQKRQIADTIGELGGRRSPDTFSRSRTKKDF